MIIFPIVNILEYVLDAFKPDMLQSKLLATTKEHRVYTFQHSKSKIQSQIRTDTCQLALDIFIVRLPCRNKR